ncbi:LuxR C-terminal-related transcriptional regulator [Halobacteriovorax sp. JY17]|uniref:helix-turn-helix transcriptional regulator n=1 Tax=Halobacteriovorax sp. JY17 TaxID=2014617 RepID=UPI000C6392DF|nr:LuxR C-terminal-related transcriptional regulator [Halobacteriovorax sp. JY17]PIK14865.1 MAG: hypothetical protein CES88_11070 [Halobacteriovorax sp. JY17]
MKKERLFNGILLFSVGVMTTLDIYKDHEEGASLGHLAIEVVTVLLSLSALAYILREFIKEKRHNEKLEGEKELLREITESFKQKSEVFIEGLSIQIDRTFNIWKFSDAERDIALFLLKGLSPKRIAEIRGSSEKTVRHQIASIYKKAGLNGREELTAYFLEDLLAPASL